MLLKLFKGYNGYVSLVWLLLVTMAFLYIYSELPFWDAWIFTITIAIPIYLCNSYLTNILQPKAMKRNEMTFFIVEFLIATFTMSLIFISVCYVFSLLVKNGYFFNAALFEEMATKKGMFMTFPIFVLINLAFCGLRFYYEHSKLQRVHLESQLQLLQAQMNPHYMFNILNHIHILMRKDVDKASFLLEKYSEILRYQLYNSEKNSVPLSQEIKFIKDVISIERLRWGNDLYVDSTWDIEDNWKNIHPLILITFIENAFKHVSRSISDKGYVKILLRQRNNILYLEIENSKWKARNNDKKKANKNLGLGIKNTKERLDILYPKNHKLNINETDEVFKIELMITLN